METNSIQIRRGTLRDAITITSFNMQMALETEHKRLDPYTISAGVKAAIEDENKAIYLVAVVDDRVVGQLMITHEWSDWRNGDMWWIQSVYVHPDFRKQGVFKALNEFAEKEARAAGAVMLRLYVERDNAAAQEVYRKLGLVMTTYGVMEKELPRN